MPPRNTNNTSNDCNVESSVDDLTKEIAKLWWPTDDHEKSDHRRKNKGEESFVPDDTKSDHTGTNFKEEKAIMKGAKYLGSLAIHNSMEKIWAKELYEMDPKEREQITNEIHGVESSRTMKESPEMISKNIKKMRVYIDETLEDELDNGDSIVPPITKQAYKRGVSFEPPEGKDGEQPVHYIRTKSFLLKFLRAAHFDIEKAALRYFRCLDLMYNLFGIIALKRPLMLSDLTKQELRYLKTGQMQLLPSRDRAGRRIIAYSGCEMRQFDVREKYRVCMYIYDVCSDDESTQKLGLVQLNSPKVHPGNKPFGETGMALRMKRHESLGGLTEREYHQKFGEGMPLRLSAIHFTGPDTFIYQIGKSLILFLIAKEDRKIVRFHGGSQIECNYSLKSYGILSDEVPITNSGEIKTKNIAKFITARRAIEEKRCLYQERQQVQKRKREDDTTSTTTMPPSPGVECPEVNCIILGNGAQYNPANLEFRDILKSMEIRREEMIARCDTDVCSMKDFVNSIIDTAQSPEYGLRFLTIDKATSLYVDIEDPRDLYNRVSQALRDQRKRLRVHRLLPSEEKPKGQDHVDQENIFCGGNGSSMIGWEAAKRMERMSGYGPFCQM